MTRFAPLALLLAAGTARGQPMDVYGFNPRTVAMGGVQGASGDFGAAYYNPALLKEGSLGVGLAYSRPSFSVTQTSEPTDAQELSASLPPDYLGIILGFTVPVGGKLADRAALGVAAFVPRRHAFRARLIDEGTGSFFRYDSPPEQVQLLAAFSARPVEGLALGAGAQVLTNYGGEASFSAVLGTTSAGRVNRRSLDNEVTGEVAPVVGVAAGPFKGARLFATWRGEHKTTFFMPVGLDLGAFGEIEVIVQGVLHYAPHTVVAGGAIETLGGRLTLGVDLGFEQWSRTPPLVADIGISLPETVTALGFDPEVISRPVEMGFRDTLVPRVGAEWRQGELALRAGYCFRPTPVPDQTGRSNFLDSDAHLVSLGAGFAVEDPIGWAKRLWLEGAAQVSVLATRQVVKQGPNRNPDYRFGGRALDLVVGARYGF